MNRDQAEALALRAFTWIMADAERGGGFLAASGATAAGLRGLLGDPGFLAAVLDHLMQEDAWVTGFAASEDLAPDRIAAARAALPGGGVPHWT